MSLATSKIECSFDVCSCMLMREKLENFPPNQGNQKLNQPRTKETEAIMVLPIVFQYNEYNRIIQQQRFGSIAVKRGNCFLQLATQILVKKILQVPVEFQTYARYCATCSVIIFQTRSVIVRGFVITN